jgi:hypothetical protein
MTKRLSPREIRAKAHAIADEIETRAQPLINMGISRDRAVMLTVAQMSGKLIIVKG